MKIDLITLQAVSNYGSVLQTFATQEFFRQHGCEVRIINYARPDLVGSLNVWPNILRSVKGKIWKLPFRLRRVLTSCKRVNTFGGFRKKYLNIMQGKQYITTQDFAGYTTDADAFCTGSDQVWNSWWNGGILPEFYLAFAPEGSYKFAFSASFGKSDIDDEEVSATQKYIDDYRHISVREDEGLKILQDKYHYNRAVHVQDPTLCIDGDTWRKYAGCTNCGGGGAVSLIFLSTRYTRMKKPHSKLTAMLKSFQEEQVSE